MSCVSPHRRVARARRLARVVLPLLAFALLLPLTAEARRGAPPLSPVGKGSIGAPLLRVAVPDVSVLKAQDEERHQAGVKTLRYAEPRPVSISPQSDGRWESLSDGTRLWRMEIEGPEATDLNVGLSEFELPYEGKFWVISTDRDYYEGPYTHEDNEEHGQLWVPVVPGDRVILELQVPAETKFEPRLEVSQVGYGYKDVFQMDGLPKQGSCNNDVVCPEGDPWRDQIQSVAAYSLGGSIFCTGQMITDADQTFRPFFLTAYHCGLTPANAPSLTVYWNFESANCGDLSGGSLSDNQTGATWRSSRQDVDMCLVELDDIPDPTSQVFYSGWDRSGDVPQGSVGIHHPNGDEKAISFNTDPLGTQSSCIISDTALTHWLVDNWEDGTTEPGSSGSGLWDPDTQLLVGFLSGGLASCTNIDYDCYGKFSVAWDGASSTTRLRDWLDPSGTGPLQAPGAYASGDGILTFQSRSGVDDCNGTTDGAIEPGEEVEISVVVDASVADVTGISGTLTSSTPGVTIDVGTAAWPDVPVGTSAANSTPFVIQLDPSVPCFSELAFSLELTDDLGQVFTMPFTLPVGLEQSPAGLPLAIPDGSPSGIDSDVVVSEDVALTDLDVRVEIAHSWIGDLRIELTSPAGTTVTLLDRPGVPISTYGCGDDDMNVTFDDDATQTLESWCPGTTPWYDGIGQPVDPLSVFDGESAAGTWTLTVADNAGADTGQILDWELIATPGLAIGECDACQPSVPQDLVVQSAAPGQVSVVVVPDGSGDRLDDAQSWDGVVGNAPTRVDATITAQVLDDFGQPVVGFAAEDLTLGSSQGNLQFCAAAGGADGPTDGSGQTTFSGPLAAGGVSEVGAGELLTVDGSGLTTTYSGGGSGLDILFNSPDLDGDRLVNLTDVSLFASQRTSGYDYSIDYVWDGVINLSDISRLGLAIGTGCASLPRQPALARADGELRVIFDLATGRAARAAAVGEEVSALLVLEGPTAREGIRGWEAALRAGDNLEIVSAESVEGTLDVLGGHDFVVGSGGANLRSDTGTVVLAHLRLRVTDEHPAHLYLEASPRPSGGAKGPVVLSDEGLRELSLSSGPVASLNDGSDGAPQSERVRDYSLGNVPNPFNPSTEIHFAMPQGGRAEIRVFDVAGRLVRRFDLGATEAGRHSLTWRGEDQSGRPVVSGVYFSRLYVDGSPRGEASKMSLLK